MQGFRSTKFFIYILLLFAFTSFANGEMIVDKTLECQQVPQRSESICSLSTPSELMPVNDVVFYKKVKQGGLVFLNAQQGDVAMTWLAGFSKHGRYTIIGKSEEGHPSFLLYDTNEFLDPYIDAKAIGFLSEYHVSHIVELSDNGRALIELVDGEHQEQHCLTPSEEHKLLSTGGCLVYIQLVDKAK